MARDRIATAAAVKPGFFRRPRAAKRRSAGVRPRAGSREPSGSGLLLGVAARDEVGDAGFVMKGHFFVHAGVDGGPA